MHLIAMAHSVDIEITLKDFQDISDKTPLLADLKPSGKYLMEDLHEAGGVPAVMKYLLKQGLLHGDCLTVTGKTLAENLCCSDLNDGQEVIHEIQKALKATGNIQIYTEILQKKAVLQKLVVTKENILKVTQLFMK
jgi:dihydroxy-acid dehydratase